MCWKPPHARSKEETEAQLARAAADLVPITGMGLSDCRRLAEMFAGDANRAAIFYMNQGQEKFLEKVKADDARKQDAAETDSANAKEEAALLAAQQTLYVILSLDEAESLRRAMQGSSDIAKALRERIALHTSDGLELTISVAANVAEGDDRKSTNGATGVPAPLLRQTTNDIMEPARNPKPFDLAAQSAKFFNSELWYDDTEVIWVLKGLEGNAESQRRVAFEATSNCRLRDRPEWTGTSIAHVFHYSNSSQLLRLRVVTVQIQRRLASNFESTTAAFQRFDKNGTGFLTLEQLTRALRDLPGLREQVSDEDCVALMKHVDHNSDGYLDYREFASNFAAFAGANDVGGGLGAGANGVQWELQIVARARRSRKQRLQRGSFAGIGVGGGSLKSNKKNNILQDLEASSKKAREKMSSSILKQLTTGPAGAGSAGSAAGATAGPAAHTQILDVSTVGQFVMTSVSGGNGAIFFSNDNLVSTGPGMRPSIAPRGVLLERETGSYYYEVTCVTPGHAYVGFGDALYTGDSANAKGIGDDAHSWGYSGYLCKCKHNSKGTPFGFAWSHGDVVGCLIDTDGAGSITFTLNGSSEAPLGCAVTSVFEGPTAAVGGICPAISFDSAFTFRVNLGAVPFRHTPPDPRARSVARWVQNKVESMYAESWSGQYGRLVSTSGNAGLEIDGMRIRPTRGFPSCIAAGVLLVGGKWYYEVTVVQAGQASQLGWADLEFVGSAKDGVGIGDDKMSWAFDGDRACTWHNGSRRFGRNWKGGDVLGVACDLGARSISFSLNGQWTKPFGKAFTNIELSGGLAPGFTAQGPGPEFIVNFGAEPLKHAPPDGEYRPVQEWIVEHAPGNTRGNKTSSASSNSHASSSSDAVPTGAASGGSVPSTPPVPPSVPLLRVTSRLRTHKPFLEKKRVSLRASSGAFQVELTDDNCVHPTGRDATSYPSVVADSICLSSGRWYYECTVLESVPRGARCSIGWADRRFVGNWSAAMGVGDDAHSWGVISTDGKSALSARSAGTATMLRTGKNPPAQLTKMSWLNRGDVLGFALDCETRVMRISLNGAWIPTAVFQKFNFTGGLTPAVSASGTTPLSRGQIPQHFAFQFNFGERPFEAKAAPTGYRAVHKWLLAEQARLRVLTLAAAPSTGGESKDNGNCAVSSAAADAGSSDDERFRKWAREKLRQSGKLDLVSEILGIQGSSDDRAAILAAELGLV